jgi:hypothetical protein
MVKFVALVAALCCISGPAVAQAGKPEFIPLSPGVPDLSEGIMIPAGSPLRLKSFVHDSSQINAAFSGRFELAGAYEVQGYGENAFAILWPDRKSRDSLPYWHERGGPDEIYISNGWDFARAVVEPGELEKLESEAASSVRGHATIIADGYETGIECDAANFSARFVSVVSTVKTAGEPGSAGEC